MTWPDAETLDAAWQVARSHWSLAVELKTPRQVQGANAVAYIDLNTRQTWVDFKLLEAKGLKGSLTALLAHEVGHHLWFPHTVVQGRRMLRFLREELSALAVSWSAPELQQAVRQGHCDYILNLLYDLLINNTLQPRHEAELVALYQALRQEPADPLFGLYLALYEALWYLPEGTLVTPATAEVMAKIAPDWRRNADVYAQYLVNAAHQHHLLLVRLLVTFKPFLLAADHSAACQAAVEGAEGMGDVGDLSPEDADRVMQPGTGEAEARAWRRAQSGQSEGAAGDPLQDARDNLAGVVEPKALALALYRRMAARLDVEVPRSEGEPPGLTPGPPEEWQVGDRITDIDWLSTLTRDGVAIPGLTLRKRAWLKETAGPGTEIAPWVELYIDSSGSMPDPTARVNHAILAAFVLARAAIDRGGRVRVIQFSHVFSAMDTFARSMRAVEPALLENINGGTRFPWDELRRSTIEYAHQAHVHRVIVTDADFYTNYDGADRYAEPGARDAGVAAACKAPRSLVVIMRAGRNRVVDALRAQGAKVVFAEDWNSVPQVARDLARALFPRAA